MDNNNQKIEPKFSRRSRYAKPKSHKWLISLIVVIVIALIAIPTYGFLTHKDENLVSKSTSTVAKKDKSSDKKKADTKADDKESDKNSESSSNDNATDTQDNASVDNNKEVSDNNATSDSEKQDDQNYVAVQAGQGPYRIATNAGITVAELQQLNPGVNLDALQPGQQIRIK